MKNVTLLEKQLRNATSISALVPVFSPDGESCMFHGNQSLLTVDTISALFYKYDDNEFFVELTKQSGNLEDMIVEAGNHPTDQKKFRQDIQSSLESIYKLIDKKRTGQKI